jgi:hypothetical protein
MSVKEVSGKAVLEAGWPEFVVAHWWCSVDVGVL